MRLDHVLLLVDNMPGMVGFLTNVIGLDDGPRPPFPFPGHWLYGGGLPLIHLASRGRDDARSGYLGMAGAPGAGVVDHVALTGIDLADMTARLDRAGATYAVRRVPGEGQIQLFVPGPEGLKVELLFSMAPTAVH